MAFSQMEQPEEQILGHGYTHKKFNCGYSHKKLGRRFRQREPVRIENIAQPPAAKHSKDIFRPYALDDSHSPRKRKTSRLNGAAAVSENSATAAKTIRAASEQNLRQPPTDFLHNSCPTTVTASEACYAAASSTNLYNMRLQPEQRAALYMRYMAQVQSAENFTASLQTALNYSMGYPHVAAAIFNGC